MFSVEQSNTGLVGSRNLPHPNFPPPQNGEIAFKTRLERAAVLELIVVDV